MTMTDIRKRYGLTQKQMSEVTGIPKPTIEAWDRGTRTPPEWLPKMVEAFLERVFPQQK